MPTSFHNFPAGEGIFPRGRLQPLVLAALGSGDTGQHWHSYVQALQGTYPNEGEIRLYPLVADHLGDAYHDMPKHDLIESAVRWARSRAMACKIAKSEVESLFDAAGIAHIWTKGSALATQVYARPELRLSQDVDALFKWADFSRVNDVASENNWPRKLPVELPKGLFGGYRSTELSFTLSPTCDLDLSWHPRPIFTFDQAMNDWLWSTGSVPQHSSLRREASLEWLLIEAIEHGLRPNIVAPIRWLVDVILILKSARSLEWEVIVDFADRYQMRAMLCFGLETADAFCSLVPVEILATLRRTRFSTLELHELTARLNSGDASHTYHTEYAYNCLRRAPSRLFGKLGPKQFDRDKSLTILSRLAILGRILNA